MNSRTRIAIVGGGPAGSATAIAILNALGSEHARLDLTLFTSTPRQGEPTIGETIPPAATPVLTNLGLLHLVENGDHLECPGSVSVWGEDQPGHNDFMLQPVGRGYHLDRARFDADLLQMAASRGCRLAQGWHLRSAKSEGQGYRLGFSRQSATQASADLPRANEALQCQSADFVIDATGIAAAFARRLGVARNLFDQVLSLCTLYDLPAPSENRPAHTLVQTTEQGWWYAARLPNRKAIVSLCTDSDTFKQDGLDAPLTWHAACLATGWFARECLRQFGAELQEPDRIHLKPAPSAILSAVAGERWLAVGDAASSYDSMSSAGITKALLHAEMAGKAVAHWLMAGERLLIEHYQDRVFADFNQYLRLHHQHYCAERRFPRSGFWQRRRLCTTL